MKRLIWTGMFLMAAQLQAFADDPLGNDVGFRASAPVTLTTAAPRLSSQEIAVGIGHWLSEGGQNSHLGHLPKREREALTTFYAARNNVPIWVGDETSAPRAAALIDRLTRADEDGLDPFDYPIAPRLMKPETVEQAAEADVALSAAALAYARDARGARIDLARLSKLITPKLDLPDAGTVLTTLIGASNPGEALAHYNPQQPGYLLLKQKLATMHEMTASIGSATASSLPTSRKPIKTTTAMVAQAPVTPFELIANMERWRWVERDLGDRYIEVNLPEFTLHVVDHGKIVHTARAVVGKPDTPTPLFSEKMQYLIVNPSWHVPYSIVKKEFLPKLAEDPDYAARSGYEVTQNGDLVTIRQPPGERNALGLVKFMFPNQHAVYLHDTPMRKLFANTDRAYSHGCVRVDDPFSLAAVVLNDPKYTVESLKALVGKGEQLIRLAQPLPVQLTYFTLVPDETGELHHVGDIYGYDQSVEAALGLGQPRVYASLR